MKKSKRLSPVNCPCGGYGKLALYEQCCEPLLRGVELAGNAERLMRSRYTAYTRDDFCYLLRTWHVSTRPPQLGADPAQTADETRWLGLTVHTHTPLSDVEARVEFTARYRLAGRGYRLKENSRFVREDGMWFYVDGDVQGSQHSHDGDEVLPPAVHRSR